MAHEPSTAARLVDRDWFSAVAPDEALKSVCEPTLAGAFVNEPTLTRTLEGSSSEEATCSSSVDVASKVADAHALYVEKLRRRALRRAGQPCTAVWLAGAVAYRCRTCQTGEQSSICVTCFRNGNLHEGHDTVVYRSETGGACDCGDKEAWSVDGCCSTHRPRPRSKPSRRSRDASREGTNHLGDASEPICGFIGKRDETMRVEDDDDDSDDDNDSDSDYSSDDSDDSDDSDASTESPESPRVTKKALRDAQAATFGLVFERLLLALESVAHARGPTRPVPAGARFAEEIRIAKALISWVLREAEAGAPLRRAAARALSSDWNPDSSSDPREEPEKKETKKKRRKENEIPGKFPNAPYGTEHIDEISTNTIRAELRKRRIAVKTRCGNVPSDPDWPIGGFAKCGLLECLLRASCLFSLPDGLMERVTTMLLAFLFVPRFKKKFGAALVRHYDAVARFPETLPWPGVAYRRNESFDAGSDGNGSDDDAADKRPEGDDDEDFRAKTYSERLRLLSPAALEFPEAAYVAASPTFQPTHMRVESLSSDPESNPGAELGGERLSEGPSRALTAYASRRTTVCRCLDRVTVQLFGAAPVVSNHSMRDALLFATAKTLERCVVGRSGPPKTVKDEDDDEGDDDDDASENAVAIRGDARFETFANDRGDDPFVYRPPSLSFDPADEAAKHRLFARPCNDLRMLLSHRDAARRWLRMRGSRSTNFFSSAVKTLLALQGMHQYRHKKGEHVLTESRSWIEAVTAETFVNSTFRAGISCVGDELASDKSASSASAASEGTFLSGEEKDEKRKNTLEVPTTLEDVETLADARDALLDACVDWHDRLVRENSHDTGSPWSADVDTQGATALLADLHASPVSMHIPAHRLWAVAAHWSMAASARLGVKNFFFSDASQRKRVCQQACHPLRVLAFADQVVNRVWVRNGEEIRRAAGVYASRYAAGVGRDADFGFAQMALIAFVEQCRSGASRASSSESEIEGSPNTLKTFGDKQRRGSFLTEDGELLDVVRFALAAGSAGAVAPKNKNASAFPFLFGTDETPLTMDVEDGETMSSDTVYPDPRSLPAGALACARSTARLFVSLTRDRSWLACDSKFESKCRREVVHQLAASSGKNGVTFSALLELLPTAIAAEAADVDKTLREVASVNKVSSGRSSGGDVNATGVAYALLDECWATTSEASEETHETGHGFDAFFHRYSRSEHDAALAEATRLWVRNENAKRDDDEANDDENVSSTFAWSPATLLRAPKPPAAPFAKNILLFTRHVCLATFVRDSVCFLSEFPDCADLQDLGVSAMALVKTALDVDLEAHSGVSDSGVSGAFSLQAYLTALFESPRKSEMMHLDENEEDPSRVPYVVKCLDVLADARPAENDRWREEDSHASVLVAECAYLLARDLRKVAGLPERPVERPKRHQTRHTRRGDSNDATMTEAMTEVTANAGGVNSREDSPPAPPTDAKTERLRLAKARQAAVLAAMAARQKAFADGCAEESDDDDAMHDDANGAAADETLDAEDAMDVDVPALPARTGRDPAAKEKGTGNSNETPARRLPWEKVPECALCGDEDLSGETRKTGDAGQLCWLARRQRAFAPSAGRARARRTQPKPVGHSEENSDSRDFTDSGDSEGERFLEDSVDALECVGFLPVTCGHGAHTKCLDRYVRSTHNFGPTTLETDPNTMDPEARQIGREITMGVCGLEFKCPLCRRICDVVVPALAATPSQTELLATKAQEDDETVGHEKDVPNSETRTAPTRLDRASSIEAALVATANGLTRGDAERTVIVSSDDKKKRDIAEDISAALASPFAEPPRFGSVSVFGGSFLRSPEDGSGGGDNDGSITSFETGPVTDTRPRDWLKLLQIVATLDAHRRIFTSLDEREDVKIPGSAEAVSAGLWRAAREIARRAMRGEQTVGGIQVSCVVTPERITRRSLTAALSRALRKRDKRTSVCERHDETNSDDEDVRFCFFSVLTFGAQVEAQAVRRFEWDVVKRRKRRASRFGARRLEAGRARMAAAEPPTTVADADADAAHIDADFFTPRFFPEHEEDPEALVAETVDAVLAEARAELSEISEISEPESRLFSGTAAAVSSPAVSSPAAASGDEKNASNEAREKNASNAKKHSSETSLFRGGDASFLRNHPFGFLVELFGRADAFEPGVFGRAGGTKKAEALARAVVFAATRSAVADARRTLERSQSEFSVAEKRFPTGVSYDEMLMFVMPRLERTAWQVETLLAILRGETFSLSAFGSANRNGDRNENDGILERLSLRLFSASFADVIANAVEDEGIDHSSFSSDDFSDGEEITLDVALNSVVAPAFRDWALPSRHEDALALFADAKCERCRLKPKDPAVCLACGAVMCCADASCGSAFSKQKGDDRDAARDERALSSFSKRCEKENLQKEARAPFFLYDAKTKKKTFAFPDATVFEDLGACSAHALNRKCGGGSGCFLLLKSTRILILHSGGQRACLFSSPYLDAHGEEDEHMRRGRPLFLNEQRAFFLEKLWACGALEHDSRATGASRLGGEWY